MSKCTICNRSLADLPEEGCEECGYEHDPFEPASDQELRFDEQHYNPYDYVPDNLIEPLEEDM